MAQPQTAKTAETAKTAKSAKTATTAEGAKTAKTERRSEILHAAIAAYARRGYHQTRVEDIAEEAGVSKGTVYLYFDSRESILTAAFDEFMAQLDESVADVANGPEPPLEKIKLLLRASFDAAQQNADLSRVMFDFWGASLHNPEGSPINVADVYDQYRLLIAGLLDDAERRGDIRSDRPSLTPNLILAMADGIVLHWMINPDVVPLDEITDAFFDLLTFGLQKQ